MPVRARWLHRCGAVVLVSLVLVSACVSLLDTAATPGASAATAKRTSTATTKRTRPSVSRRSTATTIAPPSTAPSTTPPPITAPSITAPPTSAVSTAPQSAPRAYVERAMNVIARFSVRRRDVDIAAIQRRALDQAQTARTVEETHPIIREALRALGDRHSSLSDPASARSLTEGETRGFGISLYPDGGLYVFPSSEAERAGLHTLDRVVAINGRPGADITAEDRRGETITLSVTRVGFEAPFDVTVRRGTFDSAVPPTVRRDGGIGVIELTSPRGDSSRLDNYMRVALDAIQSADASVPCGWVVDVRRNSGGFPGPQFAVLAPLLGDGPFFGTIDGDGATTPWSVQSGSIVVNGRITTSTQRPLTLRNREVPVAFLTSKVTASAGEAAVIAFIGRTAALRTFGDPTFGVTSTNVAVTMVDGALLQVTSSYDLDRTGKRYDGPLQPNEPVTVDWTKVGTPDDPVLGAAKSWLAGFGCT